MEISQNCTDAGWSLFDGIGGFPLAWEAANGKGSARWASEIEEFPIAVTKYHFPEEEERIAPQVYFLRAPQEVCGLARNDRGQDGSGEET